MSIEIGLTDGPTNTQYAPLAVLSALYRRRGTLEPLKDVEIPMKKRDFSPHSKLIQVFLSMLAGCETISEANMRLKAELGMAAVWGWDRFVDQSNLSRTLDALTLMNIDQLRGSTTAIWRAHSRAECHDWRGFLWLDFDLSGLPCSPRAEKSQKGFFSDKKTSVDASWPASVLSDTGKPSGQTSLPAIGTPPIVCSQQCWQPKMH
ncbi:MAG: hypothetical protein JSV81_05765 [Anaerolineales bacterium]|nr:MAG: hypothetical protein JSV81_05765 [Anaerolineales bacterium]